jgi:hypothetical protein
MPVKLSSFFLLMMLSMSAYGQRFQQYYPTSISLKSKVGFLIAHRANMAHLPERNNVGFELEFAQQDKSNTQWDQSYKHPQRGFSLMYQDFGNKEILGHGYSIFGHTSFPIIQKEKFGFLDFRLGTGFAYVTKPYDLITNPKNIAIGSHLNGFVNLQFNYNKHFKYWHIGAGIEFSHYSNAATKDPNLGLNIPSLNFNLGYDIKSREVYGASKRKTEDSNHDEMMKDDFHIYGVFSSKQNQPRHFKATSRPVLGLTAYYSKALGERWKLDAGLDVFYNGGNRHYIDTMVYSISETLQLGVYLGGSIHFYKAEFIIGIGTYLISHVTPFGRIYNRLGFRYHFTDNIMGTVAIKAHFGIADYLEVGLGYKLWNKK